MGEEEPPNSGAPENDHDDDDEGQTGETPYPPLLDYLQSKEGHELPAGGGDCHTGTLARHSKRSEESASRLSVNSAKHLRRLPGTKPIRSFAPLRMTSSRWLFSNLLDQSAPRRLHHGFKPVAGVELLVGVVKVVA